MVKQVPWVVVDVGLLVDVVFVVWVFAAIQKLQLLKSILPKEKQLLVIL